MSALYFSPLVNALLKLDEGLRQTESNPTNELLRDGVIHRFAYCHFLSLRLIRHAVASNSDQKAGRLSYYTVMRTAAKRGLIGDVDRWFAYRVTCSKTSRAWDAALAVSIYASARPFLTDARELLVRLTDLRNPSLM